MSGVEQGAGEGGGSAGRDERDPFGPLDRSYAAYLDENPAPPGGSLLAQTILTGPARRSTYEIVPIEPGDTLLDLGTGFGPVALELAHLARVDAVGVDSDRDVLEVAGAIRERLAGFLAPGSEVRFVPADVTDLPSGDESVDVVTARLLFQHLARPEEAIEEIRRVLRPGGRVFVFDVDDGLGVSYPDPSPALGALEAAFDACQSVRGGDRQVGRKLSSYFARAGFEVGTIRLLAQAVHVASEVGDASRALTAARLRAARDEIVARGLLGPAEFDASLDSYLREPAVERFRAECQLAAVFTRR
ncbi:MAG: methyltransferase domain-containing protein [Actinomycetota bacterium]|nr:methyltransferase domain-containing protein [Actinomycetota bacterium]